LKTYQRVNLYRQRFSGDVVEQGDIIAKGAKPRKAQRYCRRSAARRRTFSARRSSGELAIMAEINGTLHWRRHQRQNAKSVVGDDMKNATEYLRGTHVNVQTVA